MLYRGRDKREFYLASLLYDSIEFRHFESVKSLLTEKGADPNLVLPKKGISAFHLVIGCEPHDFALKVTLLILQNRGNPNLRSDEGLTTVHIAAAWGRTEILKLLLSNGGDPGVRDASGKTPFHYAAEEGFTDCLNLIKAYLPVNSDLMRNDSGTDGKCCLVLDKIIVNNGAVVGEYDIDENQSTEHSIKPSQDHLKSLPKTDTTEYILNWFTTQRESTGSSTNSTNIVDSISKSLGSSSAFECSDESAAESDSGDRESKRYDEKFITFRKVYKKTRNKTPAKTPTHIPHVTSDLKSTTIDQTVYADALSLTQLHEYSKESGVVTLPHTYDALSMLESEIHVTKQEKSSDYLTCSHTSVDSLEKNIFELPEELNHLNLSHESVVPEPKIDGVDKNNSGKSDGVSSGSNDSNELSFVSVSEVYKYVDKEQGVVLYERRLLKTPSEYAKSVKSSNLSSNLSSLPPTFEYDNKALRHELTALGYEVGPITETTKRLYLRKLYQFKKSPTAAQKYLNKSDGGREAKRVYSVELQKTLRSPDLCADILTFRSLDDILVQQFSNPDPSRKWREGVNKSSFTYLLLDPRITNNLPFRVDSKQLQPLEAWEAFLSAIFYVGKGKRSRPYQHLYDAVDLWKKNQFTPPSKKLQKIIDIWQDGYGVICLHIFLNIIPVEAYTREAAMISAIKLNNLTNVKSGEFYGIASTWQQKQKRLLGVYLLYRALGIFLNEGERQLCPADID